ncbi:circularly permuted type 2 ATP-grasp protein [Rhodospirillaceae bacterium KN72]|uniref:Circularly permuted type 2 ATP-grasp protein n=2 Tax=Pacificispira spongiicola TaxID=2729598 RepID=A0A7Y0DXB9_9PROT|nr:circularly permuted type 2 ATP-grasp protein [Pacificispira spongiicola]
MPIRDPISDYSTIPGVSDELIDASGAVRPSWRPFVDHISRLTPEDLSRRFARGDQYLRDAGVFFRQYDPSGPSERDWPLSHMPVVLHDSEFSEIADGLKQRAELLEAVVADLYGPARLVADGHLPAALVAENPEWLRPLIGVQPRSGHFLHYLAFDLGRGPDGNWWVLGDRTQAPSGLGFALENRVATRRVFSDFFADANIHRLASFFRTFRGALLGLRGDADGRVAILTPGLLNDVYYEHAYIARYLGFMLLEGEDLTVERGQVMVRTVAGLKPVSVLWRRLDAAYADPLELNDTSRLGTPGLVGAVRQGNVSLVNALGSGVLQTRAFLAFLPRICQALRGESLRLPNIATWWCGHDAERAHVRSQFERMSIGPAFSTRPLFEADEPIVAGGQTIDPGALDDAAFAALGRGMVGQEAVKLSTTPVFVDGRLMPRPMSLRVFMVRTETGWEVMHGGYARIGRSVDATAIALQQGGSVADVWIHSDNRVDRDTTLTPPDQTFTRSQPGILPSRSADNLYWMGRYVERAEGVMRLLRAYHIRTLENPRADAPLVRTIADQLELLEIDPAVGVPDGLRNTLDSAVVSASRVRDRFSVDGWAALEDLKDTADSLSASLASGPAISGDEVAEAMGILLRKISGFYGLVHENMYRFMGWRFLSTGRALERAMAMTSILARFADPAAPEGSMDLAVEVGDSVISHRRRYSVSTNRDTVIDLLALDAKNPRSVLYQLEVVKDLVAELPGSEINGQLSDLSRAILKVHTAVTVLRPGDLDTDRLLSLWGEIADVSNTVTGSYFK